MKELVIELREQDREGVPEIEEDGVVAAIAEFGRDSIG